MSSHPVYMSNAIGFSRESNSSRKVCHLRAVPLGNVADEKVRELFENRQEIFKNVELGKSNQFSYCEQS